MKTMYITPSIKVVPVSTSAMIAQSTTSVSVQEGTYTGTFNAKEETPAVKSVWDDDWSK